MRRLSLAVPNPGILWLVYRLAHVLHEPGPQNVSDSAFAGDPIISRT